jgi:hypothetical protein
MSEASPRLRMPRRAPVVVAVLAAFAVLLQPLVATSAQAAKKTPVPAPKTLPAAIEPLPSYQAPVACDPVAKSGPKKLQALLKQTYGSTLFGITRPCSGGVPTSEHMEGRAIDWMLGAGTTKTDANAFLAWLLAPDAQGNTVAMARRMGIMYVVWQNHIFRIYNPGLGWQPYEDCTTAVRKGAANDTYCHRNHVHLSFTWDGAMARTSYWSGQAVTVPDCDKPWTDAAKFSPSAKGLQYVPLAETPLLDTSTGLGVDSGTPCRLAQSGYSGEGRRLDVTVAGVAGVPANAKAVVLQVRTGNPNSKGVLQVAPAGAARWAVDAVTQTAGVSDSNAVTVPVGSGGAVSLTLSIGQTYVAVDVLGYLVPPGDPAGTELHAIRPRVALSSTLVSSASVGLTRSALGVPATATAVSLAVTVSGGSVGGGVRVFGAADPAPPVRAAAPTAGAGRTEAGVSVVRLGPGTSTMPVVLLRNGTGTRAVQVVVTGWYAPSSVAGGSLYQVVRPATILDTTKHGAALLPGVTSTLQLTGHGVPTNAVAVVVEARLSAAARTLAAVWPTGAKPVARVLADESGRTSTTQLLAPLDSLGRSLVAADAGPTDLRLVAVGAWVPAG